ncbi:MAG: hypothetical protein HY674_07815 [Chloroflexi bacterium]|nr:hypothetical protein [Chloroflexota bacterium]
MIGWSLILSGAAALAGETLANPAPTPEPLPAVTQVAQLRRLGLQPPTIAYSLRLEGNVWWASPAQGRLVLQDASGAEALEMELGGQPVASGQRVRVEGKGTTSASRRCGWT